MVDMGDGSDEISEILNICLTVDTMASRAYNTLSKLAESEAHKALWIEMFKEETSHVVFWKKIIAAHKLRNLPEVFDDPQQVIRELRSIIPDAEAILRECEKSRSISDALILAYRLESHMIHPAFVTLFEHYGNIVGDQSANTEYDSHINQFVEALIKYGGGKQELKMLGEALKHLWDKNRKLVTDSTRDPLTSLLNRRAFFDMASRFASLALRQKTRVGIMLIDVDNFKAINDQDGHPAGDAVLSRVGKALVASVRNSDLVGRYGGDEFIVFLFSPLESTGMEIAERLRNRMETDQSGSPQPSTVSVGFASELAHEGGPKDLEDLVRMADVALYEAKRTGKNRAVCYTPEMG